MIFSEDILWLTLLVVPCLCRSASKEGDDLENPLSEIPLLEEHCDICECFLKYYDRDSDLSLLPYASASVHDEAECLSLCYQDQLSCKSVVHGIVRGRTSVTCELYAESAMPSKLYHRYVMNYFEPKFDECSPRTIPLAKQDLTEPDTPAIYQRKRSGMNTVLDQLGLPRVGERRVIPAGPYVNLIDPVGNFTVN